MYKLAIFPLLVAAASAGYLSTPVGYATPVHAVYAPGPVNAPVHVPAATSYANTYRVSSTVRATPLVQHASPVFATAPTLPQYSTGYTSATGNYGGYRGGSYGYGFSSYGTASGSSGIYESGNSGSYGSESSYGSGSSGSSYDGSGSSGSSYGSGSSGSSYGSGYERASNSY